MEIINNDIYDITKMVTDLQKSYINEETEETLSTGIYGYLADIHSLQLQNSIIVGSELGNELFPSKAKFEKNIIAHAIIENITDINATPSTMSIVLGIEEKKLLDLFVDNTFKIDKESIINIEKFEFHLEYDLIIDRVKMINGEYIYTSRYDMSVKNSLSKITNPYLPAPFIQVVNTEKYVYFYCEIMQVEHDTIYKKVISSSVIENKTFEFEFGNQLADFFLCVNDNGKDRYLTPMFEGVGIQNNLTDYCFYTFLNSNNIRVKFDSMSYIPPINTDITVYIRTTRGEEGNFEYQKNFFTVINSDKYKYRNLSILIMPASNSTGGMNKKPIDELRKLIPKESLAKGSVTNVQDLENYFNMINIETSTTTVQKKIDNQFERSYYTYLLFKDKRDNIIPTNTINLELSRSEFETNVNRKYVLRPGTKLLYDGKYGRVLDNIPDDKLQEMLSQKETFIYTTPFMVVVNGDPLYMSYYLNLINEAKTLDFSYINPKNALQFISTSIGWTRKYTVGRDTYKLNMKLSPNSQYNEDLIKTDENGEIIEENIKTIAVLYNDMDSQTPYRYQIGKLEKYNLNGGTISPVNTDGGNEGSYFSYSFKFKTTDEINDKNQLKILNMCIPMTGDNAYGYMNQSVKLCIYVAIKNSDGSENGRYDLDNIVPGMEGYTVTNVYTVNGGLNFYKNYSSIIRSRVTANEDIIRDNENVKGFKIQGVPCIRYTYANEESNMEFIIEELNYRKAYIDKAISLLNNSFLIDFKFYNSYGPSKIYSIDSDGLRIIPRVNLTLNFELKLLKNSDVYTKDKIIKDVKSILEDLNEMDDLHIPNMITTITNTYRNSIEYFEFLGINDYGPSFQHLYKNESDDITLVPEFLTVHTNDDLTPDINVRLA